MLFYKKVSVIVPTYNEKNRILSVVANIKKSPYVQEIIIADASNDIESKRINESIQGVKHMLLANKGKAYSIKKGVLQARADAVIFIDSDLLNFTVDNFNALVEAFFVGGYDMVIGEREKEIGFARLSGMAITLAGERIIKKQILIDHMEIFTPAGYLLESSINKFFFKRYKVGKVLLKGVGQVWKEQKIGVGAIFVLDIPWMFQFVKYLGIRGFIRQLIFAKRLKYIQV